MSNTHRRVLALGATLVVAAGSLLAQPRREDTNTRSVSGQVVDESNAPAPKAVVQIKDTKTLQVRSFITQQDGNYHFAGLSTNVDYEIRADRDGVSSGTKTLTVFDSRKNATVNLKLDKK